MTTSAKSRALRFHSIACSLGLLSASVCIASPPWYVPAKGSTERAQIMDTLRTRLATFEATNRNLIFVVTELCVSASYGWLSVEPQSRDGKTRLEAVQASFKRVASEWIVDAIACGEEDCPKGTDPEAIRNRINPRCA